MKQRQQQQNIRNAVERSHFKQNVDEIVEISVVRRCAMVVEMLLENWIAEAKNLSYFCSTAH